MGHSPLLSDINATRPLLSRLAEAATAPIPPQNPAVETVVVGVPYSATAAMKEAPGSTKAGAGCHSNAAVTITRIVELRGSLL